MLTLKALYFQPCRGCISRLNIQLHGQHMGHKLSNLTVAGKFIHKHNDSQNRQLICRCHHTKQAQEKGCNIGHDQSSAINKDEQLAQHVIHVDSTDIPSQGRSSDSSPRQWSRKKTQAVDHHWRRPEGLDTGIQIYNSLTREKEPLILPNGRIASWYQCGPTVYDNAHIGHASAYIRTDMVRRVLMHLFNIDVVQVMGVTDIDDKIIKRAKELRYQDFTKMTRQFEASFFRDMETLKVLRPTVITRVTEHMPHILRFVQKIMDNGYAYKTAGGSVYFDVQEYGRYGRLWTHNMEMPIRDPMDKKEKSTDCFALWKAVKPGEPFWESPWGEGRPGWHIECSTMASAVFGESLDIHSGGDDLKFPHHENEMAQSEACFCGQQWTNYWIHTGSLHLKDDESKMSKSLLNTLSVQDMLKSYTPNQFRLFCMLRPYRNQIDYSDEAMQKAVSIHRHWCAFLNTAETYISGQLHCNPISEAALAESLQQTKENVEKALADDFDFPRAISEMEKLVNKGNVELASRSPTAASLAPRSPGIVAGVVAYVERIMDMFGLEASKRKMTHGASSRHVGNIVDSVVKFRSKVRNFALDPSNAPPEVTTEADTKAGKDQRDAVRQKMKPLLHACDDVRDDLQYSGVKVMDHGNSSSWDIMEQSPLPEPSKRRT